MYTRTVNLQFRRMRYLARAVRYDTLVHAAVVYLDFGYVEMTDDISDFGHVLAHRHPPVERIKYKTYVSKYGVHNPNDGGVVIF